MRIQKILLILTMMFILPSCTHIARTFSTPTYSLHSNDKIQLDNKNYTGNVFIKKGSNDVYGIQQSLFADIKKKMEQNNINVVSNIDNADYILSVKMRDISVDIDLQFAEYMRNALLAKETNYPYIFDNNNTPHIDNGAINFKQTTKKTTYRRFLPATLYTMLGGGLGFTIGFIAAGSTAPFAFGICGAFAVGSLTYLAYNTFRKAGVIISYDIIVEQRNEQTLKHNRKTLTKKSSNSSDETYYTYNDKWNTLTSKNIVIAIGSRALRSDMIKNITPMIADNVVEIFQTK